MRLEKQKRIINIILLVLTLLISSTFSLGAVVSHSPAQVTPGTFAAGNYIFQNNLSVNGNVGIGTSSPSGNLHIIGNSGEGSPTFDGGNTLIIQHNNNGNWNRETIIASSIGSSVLEFGDASNANAGYIRYDHSSDKMHFSTNSTGVFDDKITIDSSGRVGIGTSNPSYKLHIRSIDDGQQMLVDSTSSHSGITVSSANNSYIPFVRLTTSAPSPNDFDIGVDTDGDLYFNPNTASGKTNAALVVEQGGNIGIGTTSPGAGLHINTATDGNDQIRISSTTGGTGEYMLIGAHSTSDYARIGYWTGSAFGGVLMENKAGVGAVPTSGDEFLVYTADGNGDASIMVGNDQTNKFMRLGYSDGSDIATIQGGSWGGTTRHLVLQGGGGNVGIGTINPSTDLEVDGNVKADHYLTGSSNIGSNRLIFILNYISYATATAQCSTGRAISVPVPFQGLSGNTICAADTASDGARTTCTAVKRFYITVGGSAGFYSGGDKTCSESGIWALWPYSNDNSNPNSYSAEWRYNGYVVCCN